MPSHNKNVFTNIDPKCLRHSAQMPSALSSTILDYYHKYGRNRDLEKYLRFRNRSSSGSSIHLSPNDESRVGRSLENLNILEACLEPEKSPQKSKSNESLNKSGHLKLQGTMEKGKSEDEAISDNQIKLTSKKAVKSKKKYNINMDTCIEITLPQQSSQQPSQQPIYKQQTSMPFESPILQDFSQQKIECETSETQTERIEYPKTPNRSEFDVSDIPARPSSVASSAASISNKQRLEWDSMADVGYNKSAESNNLANLTEFERKALKKFFASHGVNFDDEMVVFASKTKLSNSVPELRKQSAKGRMREKWEIAFQKILEEKYAKRNGKTKQVKVGDKRLWQSALMKFREKYGINFNPESDLCITDPSVHSTPLSIDTSKGAIPKVRSKILETKNPIEDVVNEQIEHVEKACQTSFTMSSKECQVDSIASGEIALDYQDISSTRSSDNSKESEKSIDCKEGLISAASFEFFVPGTYHGQDKENIPPRLDDKENEFPTRAEGTTHENKENVPPKVLNDEEIIEKFNLSTPANTTTEASSGHTDELFGAISNLENDLAKGIEILCSLGNSKELSEEKKKKLVRKIIRRITKAKYKDSTASSESIISSEPGEFSGSENSKSVIGKANSKPNISGVNTLSSSSSSNCHKESSSAKEKSSGKKNSSKENSIKDWLKPFTQSELEHERNKSKETNVIEKLIEIENKGQLSKASQSDESKIDSNILKFVENQRKSRLEWIDNEICHLVNVKEYLKAREADVMKDIINLDLNRRKIHSADGDESKRHGVIYENVTIRPSNAKNNYAEVKSTGLAKNGKVTTSKDSAINHYAKENSQSRNENDLISNASSSLEWNSHINMQQYVRNRKKLQTPNEDIASYAHAKEQEFIGKYEYIRSRPIYTQPYSSDHSEGHYSQPRDNDRKTSSKKNTNDAYTSITGGSDGFLSSDSVSIPVANSTSNTTTHQYDTRASVAVQTTNSLTRTAPIFKVRLPSCNCRATCNCVNARRPTIRVKTQTNDKQLQVMPKAISYDISFDEKKQKIDMKSKWDDKQVRKENYLRHSDTSSTSSKDSKEKSEKTFVGNFGGCAKLSLQDHLKAARPDFVSQADERRKCVIELHNLREKRNEQRNRLFLLSSNHSLRNHMKTLNPPPIVAKRIFTTKALKQQTRNRYNRLPEIVFKEEIERQNRIKRSNRIVRDMFNKNLQTRVLKGQTDLSNSVFVAAI